MKMDRMREVSQTEYMAGNCNTMCPRGEMLLREKENLLHKFEIKEETQNSRQPKADPDKVIKCYSRSAAGHKICSSDLRPFPVLLKTIRYLFHNVFPIHKESPLTVYDFMFDRLRSVRQDMVIQNFSPVQIISILEPIARFHIYFGYVLTEEDGIKFDSFINKTHLQECLKKLLVCYDECESERGGIIRDIARITVNSDDNFKNRCDIEGAYLLFNLPHIEALTRGAKLADTVISSELVRFSFAWYLKNYVRVLRSLKNLPPLLLCAVSGYIPEIRKYSLEALSHAFSCTNSSYPVSHLKDLLLYETNSDLINDCCHFNVKVSENNVKFLKKDFNSSAELPKLKRLFWIDECLLKCDLVQLLCYGNE